MEEPDQDYYFDGSIQASDGARQTFSDLDRFNLIMLLQRLAEESEGLGPHQKFTHEPTGKVIWVRHCLSRSHRDHPSLDSSIKIMRDLVFLYLPSEA